MNPGELKQSILRRRRIVQNTCGKTRPRVDERARNFLFRRFTAKRVATPLNFQVMESITADDLLVFCYSDNPRDCSEEQSELMVSMVKSNGRVWAISDGNPAGERFGKSVLEKVAPHHFVRWMRLGEGQQPTDMSAEQLETLHQSFTW